MIRSNTYSTVHILKHWGNRDHTPSMYHHISIDTFVFSAYTSLILLGAAFGVTAIQWLIPLHMGDATSRCTQCSYSFDGLPLSSRCPECGSNHHNGPALDANSTRTKNRSAVAFLLTYGMVVFPAGVSAFGIPPAIYLTVLCCPIAMLYMLGHTTNLDTIPRRSINLGLVLSLPAGLGLSLGLLAIQGAMGNHDALDGVALIVTTPLYAAGAFGWWVALVTFLQVNRG